MNVKLSSIKDVKEFIRITNLSKHDISAKSNNSIVNAKSILGIYSLDLLNNIELIYIKPIEEKVINELKQFEVVISNE